MANKKTSEMVTINDAIVQAIAQAVTSAVVSALSTTATASVDAPPVKASKGTKAGKPTTASDKKGAGKSSKAKSPASLKKMGVYGYIETKAGDVLYIHHIDRNKNAWVCATDENGNLLVDDNGKVIDKYDNETYKAEKDKAIKANKYTRDKKGKYTASRTKIYKSLKWVVTNRDIITL